MKKILIYLISMLMAAGFAAADDKRPNILLLMADDVSQRIGAFDDTVAVTPELDKIAAAGVRYPNTFATSGVCAPSRAAIIMGAHQISFGAQHMRTDTYPQGSYRTVPPPQMKAFPELLRAAGYYTFTTNKLDYQFSGGAPGSGPFTIWDAEGHDTDWHGRPDHKPFFGYMNFLETHESGVFSPLGTMPHSLQHFLSQLLRAYQFGIPESNTPVKASAVQVPPYFPDTPTVRTDMARHYNNIAQMDHQIGAILKQLDAEGLLANTIVIWTADNGDGLPRAKREIYDSGVKVPMIVLWPEQYRPSGVTPGSVDTRMISLVDLAPTILALAGVPVPDYVQGRNFADTETPARTYIYAERDRVDEVPDRQRLVRDKDFAYIYSYHPEQGGGEEIAFRSNIDMMRELQRLHADGELNPTQQLWFLPPGEERLYDVNADPHQIRDLSNDPAYAEQLSRLRTEYLRWRKQVVDMSDESEEALVERFFPDGKQPVTPPPQLVEAEGNVAIRSNIEGASIGYRVDEGAWQLYTEPVAVASGQTLEAKAIRYGWKESEVSTFQRKQ